MEQSRLLLQRDGPDEQLASGGSGGFGGAPAAVGFGDGLLNGEIIQGSQTNGIAAILANHHIWFDANLAVVPPTPPTPPTTGVPEPESIALPGLGLGGLGIARRRKHAGFETHCQL